MSTPPLASGPQGPHALGPLLDTVLEALRDGTLARGGPLPAGGPDAVAARVRSAVGDVLPQEGTPDALYTVVRTLAETAADPAHPHCTAHLHGPPLAAATAADLATSTLNPSQDSWDQSPGTSELEHLLTQALATTIYTPADPHPTTPTHPHPTTPTHPRAATPADPRAATPAHPRAVVPPGAARVGAGGTPIAPGCASHPAAIATPGTQVTPDCLVTSGGTEANQLALLLAREAHPGTRLICGANAHHSLTRATWLLGLPDPVIIPAPAGTLDPAALDEALTHLPGPHLVAATAGTTDAGLIDPLPEIAALCAAHGARLHIDAAYGGPLLFSDRHRPKLTGLDAADTVTTDLHKLGWQPVAAGLLAVRDARDLTVLHQHADYLNADDDTEAGLPDLLGRSLRTTRRPDILKIAVTLKTLGRNGIGRLVDQVCARAQEFADLIAANPAFELYDRPTISTVLFRPTTATDTTVAAVRRTLLTNGRAALGRARLDGRLWLKATLLNPHTRPDDLAALLKLVEGTTPR
ncbi:pyridoxal phosphate-dependent decarboxylase family protein [Streptomyces sp. TRM68416]|uniref:pyridoxal phosphate-dependent decarboxylase family protein n=1 Tax=Streptomyces sp. TRM68416 TaxID=2758412 RepID=UPI001661ABFC|nr:aminotransferase class V-fold PLP-dependent enzyme [Streptomyces sp. TRM68416]MBD0842601.1 aspartate aminotransferase family protein [Streptomyces sp. TRM68416]